ncbi:MULTISPECIES: hypothetical protein [unclassified Fibrobacter]|uniref:hypothetical protein n=1 Tax=unclassified Fibrobacter TaxID=2634177 RepID=UPI0009152716|nr:MULTISPECIES: hypothetical protein [Fibrobacter]MCL4100934.1 hypothetical protein [Fibrobacter succinogenes]MDO4946597.1 hypothetical protein [Fibrobacter sp.]OWV00971.1 hypothetical protein B7993_15835 [Fibrobacter sp. UWH3]SHK19274.1 hypothetical protein SAMN05720765_101164 [Fibrobacter sp. UWH6]
MAYQIECVIQEVGLAVNGCVSSLKVKGTEGYLLKQGSDEYNVFCPEKMLEKNESCDDGKIESGKQTVLLNVKNDLNFKTTICYGIAQSLIQAKISNTKVRLKFEEPPSKSKSTAGTSGCEKIEAKIISITLI